MSGLDQHSLLADPLFYNFPYCMAQVTDMLACTKNVIFSIFYFYLPDAST